MRAFSCRPSLSSASSTARPILELTGLPPADEKKLPSCSNASAIAAVVITAPSG